MPVISSVAIGAASFSPKKVLRLTGNPYTKNRTTGKYEGIDEYG
jgi:hypothetical protein